MASKRSENNDLTVKLSKKAKCAQELHGDDDTTSTTDTPTVTSSESGMDEHSSTSERDDLKKLARKYTQKFLDKYTEIPGIKQSRKGRNYAYCDYCHRDFSIGNSGLFDITRHRQNVSHINNEKMAKRHQSIERFCESTSTSSYASYAVTKAETMMTDLIVDMNLPLTAADKITQVVKKAFPDSKIAQRYECSRSKTTAIIKCVAALTKDDIVQKMQTGPYSISTDGSNDQQCKQFPIVVSLPGAEGVTQNLLSVPVLSGSATGENIFNLVHRELTSRNIPLKNCLAFGTDNANVVTGKHKGVFAFMLKENSDLHLAGCPCHLIHHAAEHASQCLPFSIDDILVNTYYYIDKSSKRIGALEEFQHLYDVKHQKILKHVPTRWLSIERCLDRILENWNALKMFFKKEAEQRKKTDSEESVPERLAKFFKSPTNKLYCFFLQYGLKPFCVTNVKLQDEAPQVHKLQRTIRSFLRELLVKFVAPWAMTGQLLVEVKYKVRTNQKKNTDILIGEAAKTCIFKKKEVNLRESRITEFFETVRNFYEAGVDYVKEKLPLHQELLEKVQICDVTNRTRASTLDFNYFLQRFPCLIPRTCTVDQLEMEFATYQSLTSIKEMDRIDHTWKSLGELRDEAGELMFPNLSAVMLGILTIPHSNAQCERIFSCVRKNKTDQRACLGSETLDALMVCKTRPNELRQYSDDQLKKIKSAYSVSLSSKKD
jgi:hypothetical protein